MSKKIIWIITVSCLLVTIAMLIWLYAQEPEKVPSFLPGIYACIVQNDFCRIEDTLTIRRTQLGQDNYAVIRSTGFTRIRKGRKEERELEQQRWTALFTPRWSTLVSSDSTKKLWYVPLKNFIYKDDFFYEKIE